MIKINKHIATILSGIFIFPIAFQSVHIVRHHAHDHYACHHVCNNHSNYLTATINAAKVFNKCPICEYKFPINNLPTVSVPETNIPKIEGVLIETIIVQPHLQIFEMKSPRAPPLPF